MIEDVIIGVDLGGTRIRAARMDENLTMQAREETLTKAADGFEASYGRILSLIRAVWPNDGVAVRGIGVSIPGPTNPFTGVVELGTNLAGWQDVPLAKRLEDEFGVPVFLGNDANVAVLAETAIGASQGYEHVIFITVSTGIGGGVLIKRRLLLGNEGLGGEMGHIVMLVGDGETPHVSTLEKESAGPALARKARARLETGEASLMRDLVGGDLSKVSGKTVGDAALQGDPLALAIVKRGGFVLGCGIASFLHLFNPQIIVLGGSVTNVGDLLFAPMREAIQQYSITDDYWRDLQIVRAGLGEDVSLIGAGTLVLTRGGQDDVSTIQRALDT